MRQSKIRMETNYISSILKRMVKNMWKILDFQSIKL